MIMSCTRSELVSFVLRLQGSTRQPCEAAYLGLGLGSRCSKAAVARCCVCAFCLRRKVYSLATHKKVQSSIRSLLESQHLPKRAHTLPSLGRLSSARAQNGCRRCNHCAAITSQPKSRSDKVRYIHSNLNLPLLGD